MSIGHGLGGPPAAASQLMPTILHGPSGPSLYGICKIESGCGFPTAPVALVPPALRAAAAAAAGPGRSGVVPLVQPLCCGRLALPFPICQIEIPPSGVTHGMALCDHAGSTASRGAYSPSTVSETACRTMEFVAQVAWPRATL